MKIPRVEELRSSSVRTGPTVSGMQAVEAMEIFLATTPPTAMRERDQLQAGIKIHVRSQNVKSI